MTTSGWRLIGVSPAGGVALVIAAVAWFLSRSTGSGWLIVTGVALVAIFVFATLWTLLGAAGLRLSLDMPTDATVGETLPLQLTVRAPIRQMRVVQLRCLDESTHVVIGNGTVVVRADALARGMTPVAVLHVRVGFPLAMVLLRRTFRFELKPPLAVGPAAVAVSLRQALGDDDGASVRAIRPYVRGDTPRVVHWRSSARRGELMVREFESIEPLRGTRLELRVDLRGDPVAAEATAGEAAGLAYAALDAGMAVFLLTAEPSGPRAGAVANRRDVARRLAAAVAAEPAPPSGAGRVIELRAP